MKNLKYILLFVFIYFFMSQSFSLPRFALRSGSQCVDCHINPTGGEMRTSRGWNVGKKYLPINTTDDDFKMSNKLNENIQFGLDFRGNYLIVMDSASTKSDFQRMEGSIYTNIDLSEDVNIYARYDFIWGIWEAYGLAKVLSNGSYIKGGSFVPNYGIRLDDHTAYTRGGDLGRLQPTGGALNRGLIYEPRYVESGVEAGLHLTDFAFLTASVGKSASAQLFASDPTYTASLMIQPQVAEGMGLFFGGSFASFKTQRFDAQFNAHYPNVNMFGGFVGIGVGDFTIMGEYDIANDYLADNTKTSAMMVEAAYKIIKGIDAVIRYDRYDENTDISGNEFSRYVIGFDIFPYSFMEILPQFRLQKDTPSIKNNSAVIQMHLYY